MFKIGESVKIVSRNKFVTKCAPLYIVGEIGVIVGRTETGANVRIKDGSTWYVDKTDIEHVSTKTSNFSPKIGDKVWYVALYSNQHYAITWQNDKENKKQLKRGLVKPTRQAARDRHKEIMEFLERTK
jgi:hypothetical protein